MDVLKDEYIEVTDPSPDPSTVDAIKNGRVAISERGEIWLDDLPRTQIALIEFLAAAQAAHHLEIDGAQGIQRLERTVECAKSAKSWYGVFFGSALMLVGILIFIDVIRTGPPNDDEITLRLALFMSAPFTVIGWLLLFAKWLRLGQHRDQEAGWALQANPNEPGVQTRLFSYYSHRFLRDATWLETISTAHATYYEESRVNPFFRPPLELRQLIPRTALRRQEISFLQPEHCLDKLAIAGFVVSQPDSRGRRWLTRDPSEISNHFNHVRAALRIRSIGNGSSIELAVFQPRWIPILFIYAAVAGALWRREMMLAGVASLVFLAMILLDCWRPVKRLTRLWLLPWGLIPLVGVIVAPNPDNSIMSPADAMDVGVLIFILILVALTPMIFALDRHRVDRSRIVLRMSFAIGLISVVGCVLFPIPGIAHTSFVIAPTVGTCSLLLLLLPILETARAQQNALSYQIRATLATLPSPADALEEMSLHVPDRSARERITHLIQDEATSLARNSVVRAAFSEISVMSISSLRQALPMVNTYLISVLHTPLRLPKLVRDWPASRSVEVVQTLKAMLFALFIVGLLMRGRQDADTLFGIGNNVIDVLSFVFVFGLGITRLSDPANLRRINLVKTFLACGTIYAINLPVIAVISIVWAEIEVEGRDWTLISAVPLTMVWVALLMFVIVRWLAEANKIRWTRVAGALACSMAWLGPIEVLTNPMSHWGARTVEYALAIL